MRLFIPPRKVLLNAITTLFVSTLLIACGGTEDEAALGTQATERDLFTTSDSTYIYEISSYFSLQAYGRTLKQYQFEDQNAIMFLSVDNLSTDFNVSVSIYLFDQSLDFKDIRSWASNNYSDAIVLDVPEPISTYRLTADQFSVTNATFIDHTVHPNGDEYDNYQLEVFVDNVFEEAVFYLPSFTTPLPVHVMTKDINSEGPYEFP